MDGFVARKGLLAPGRLRGLGERPDLRGRLRLGGHLAALAARWWSARPAPTSPATRR